MALALLTLIGSFAGLCPWTRGTDPPSRVGMLRDEAMKGLDVNGGAVSIISGPAHFDVLWTGPDWLGRCQQVEVWYDKDGKVEKWLVTDLPWRRPDWLNSILKPIGV
jgi:hypothetical protein